MARIKVKVCSHTYRFLRPATTSRGTLYNKQSWFVRLEEEETGRVGYGEIPFFPGLSQESLEEVTNGVARLQHAGVVSDARELYSHITPVGSEAPSALVFGLECAIADLDTPEPLRAYPRAEGSNDPLPINGLVWMDNSEGMRQSLNRLVSQGFKTIKLKIGALDWSTELALVEYARRKYPDITIRVDANGAYRTLDEALTVCGQLAERLVHSIEQPLPPGHPHLPALCRESPLPIALDESLIGWQHLSLSAREAKLDEVSPAFLVLKPSLIGGLAYSKQWVQLAKDRQIDIWYTSALETPLSLGYLAELALRSGTTLPHGLSTGRIFDPASGAIPPSSAHTEGQWLTLNHPPDLSDRLQAWWAAGATR